MAIAIASTPDEREDGRRQHKAQVLRVLVSRRMTLESDLLLLLPPSIGYTSHRLCYTVVLVVVVVAAAAYDGRGGIAGLLRACHIT